MVKTKAKFHQTLQLLHAYQSRITALVENDGKCNNCSKKFDVEQRETPAVEQSYASHPQGPSSLPHEGPIHELQEGTQEIVLDPPTEGAAGRPLEFLPGGLTADSKSEDEMDSMEACASPKLPSPASIASQVQHVLDGHFRSLGEASDEQPTQRIPVGILVSGIAASDGAVLPSLGAVVEGPASSKEADQSLRARREESDADRMFDRLDTNKDGVIDRLEFMQGKPREGLSMGRVSTDSRLAGAHEVAPGVGGGEPGGNLAEAAPPLYQVVPGASVRSAGLPADGLPGAQRRPAGGNCGSPVESDVESTHHVREDDAAPVAASVQDAVKPRAVQSPGIQREDRDSFYDTSLLEFINDLESSPVQSERETTKPAPLSELAANAWVRKDHHEAIKAMAQKLHLPVTPSHGMSTVAIAVAGQTLEFDDEYDDLLALLDASS